mgnify:CR=1 FL=1
MAGNVELAGHTMVRVGTVNENVFPVHIPTSVTTLAEAIAFVQQQNALRPYESADIFVLRNPQGQPM